MPLFIEGLALQSRGCHKRGHAAHPCGITSLRLPRKSQASQLLLSGKVRIVPWRRWTSRCKPGTRGTQRRFSPHRVMRLPCSIAMSVSIGTAAVTQEHRYLSFKEIIGWTDHALYSAKAEGRNCVRISDLPRPAAVSEDGESYMTHSGKKDGSTESLAEAPPHPTLPKLRSTEYFATAEVTVY